MAPSTCRTRTAVGVSSVKKSGAEAGMIDSPRALSNVVTCELDRQVTREAVWRLHDYGLRTVRREVLQHLSEAGALIDRVRATHGRVVILPNDGEACSFGECLNGCSLTCVAVFIRANIGSA
jgi:hypothetical protein